MNNHLKVLASMFVLDLLSSIKLDRLSIATVMLLSLSLTPRSVDAGLFATLSIEDAGSSVVGPGDTVAFSIWLRDLVTDSSTDAVEAFFLDFSASDPALTADYSSFLFQLDSGLSGILGGLVFDGDASDDGVVGFGADSPPLGLEKGIAASMGDVLLGQLSLSAPTVAGNYQVTLAFDNADPFSPTYLLVNDGSLFGQLVPGDGTLTVNASTFTVETLGANPVPEPSSIAIMMATVFLGLRARSRSRRKVCL